MVFQYGLFYEMFYAQVLISNSILGVSKTLQIVQCSMKGFDLPVIHMLTFCHFSNLYGGICFGSLVLGVL